MVGWMDVLVGLGLGLGDHWLLVAAALMLSHNQRGGVPETSPKPTFV